MIFSLMYHTNFNTKYASNFMTYTRVPHKNPISNQNSNESQKIFINIKA